MTLSQDRLDEYWAILDEIDRMSKRDLVALWNSFDTDDKDAMAEALRAYLPEIVGEYRALAANTALVFYEETQGIPASASRLAQASAVETERLSANIGYAIYGMASKEPLKKLAGIVTQHVMNGSRDYAVGAFADRGDVWVRAARPGACEFCRMLATRAVTSDGYTGWGSEYLSAARAEMVGGPWRGRNTTRPEGSKFHDNCKCIPVRKADFKIPQHVHDWAEEYYAATEAVGSNSDTKAILAEMRQLHKQP